MVTRLKWNRRAGLSPEELRRMAFVEGTSREGRKTYAAPGVGVDIAAPAFGVDVAAATGTVVARPAVHLRGGRPCGGRGRGVGL